MFQDKMWCSKKHYLNWVHQLLKLCKVELSFKNDRSIQIAASTQSCCNAQAAWAAWTAQCCAVYSSWSMLKMACCNCSRFDDDTLAAQDLKRYIQII